MAISFRTSFIYTIIDILSSDLSGKFQVIKYSSYNM